MGSWPPRPWKNAAIQRPAPCSPRLTVKPRRDRPVTMSPSPDHESSHRWTQFGRIRAHEHGGKDGAEAAAAGVEVCGPRHPGDGCLGLSWRARFSLRTESPLS
jgi:hypothetical protein